VCFPRRFPTRIGFPASRTIKENYMPSTNPPSLEAIAAEIDAATRPATALERFFASEVAYAKWELDRVRAHKSNTGAEAFLNSAYSRASRNWNRARKELTALQSIRVNRVTRFDESTAEAAAAFPLADAAQAPVPAPAKEAN